jgi:hypothetical protein
MGLKRRGKVTGNGRRRGFRSELEDDWQVGPSCRRGKRGGWGTGSVAAGMGRGLLSSLGRTVSPRSNLIFISSFSFFFFWIFDLSFEKVLLFRFERNQS